MKRLTAILAAAVLIIAMSVMSVSAAGLEITKVTPKDGTTGRQPANMAIKVGFSEDMTGNESLDAANKSKITISDPEGKTFDFTIAHSAKYPNELWLVVNDTLDQNTEYTVTISAGITSTSGSQTSEALTTTFKTRNVNTDSTISMVMMVVMIGLMMFMSQKEMKKTNKSYFSYRHTLLRIV